MNGKTIHCVDAMVQPHYTNMVCIVLFFSIITRNLHHIAIALSPQLLKQNIHQRKKNLLGEKFTEGEGLTPSTPGYS